MAMLMIVFGLVTYARPAWGGKAAIGLVAVSVVSLFMGDQFWIGVLFAVPSAFLAYRDSVMDPQKPSRNVYFALAIIPVIVLLGIVGYVLTFGPIPPPTNSTLP